MTARDTRTAPGVPGVIDTLSEGFAQVNRVLWVILLPIALDVLLWRAPRLSIAPVVERWLQLYNQATADLGGQASGAFVDPQTLSQVGKVVGEFNLFGLLASDPFYMGAGPFIPWNLAKAWIPAIVPQQALAATGVLTVDRLASAVGLAIGMSMAGLLLGGLFVSLIGVQVRDGRIGLLRVLSTMGRCWLSVVGFVLLFLGAVIAVSIPLAIVIALLSLVAPGAAVVVYIGIALIGLLVEFWMLVYLFFTVDAIVVGGYGPLRAAKSSVLVVRHSLGSALGLIGLTLFISLGLQIVWGGLAGQFWGLPLAIIGNAYVSSGLIAASMMFYRNRAVMA